MSEWTVVKNKKRVRKVNRQGWAFDIENEIGVPGFANLLLSREVTDLYNQGYAFHVLISPEDQGDYDNDSYRTVQFEQDIAVFVKY